MAPRILVLAIPLGCLAQTVTLGLSSGAASPGSTVTLAVSLNASGTSPSAIQWAAQYSTEIFSSATVTASTAVTASAKTVSCNLGAGTTTCILWGANAEPIANEIIADVQLTVS
jgi:hypothetical protein